MKNDNIKELNDFLKGEYMAINKYDHYIKNVNSADIKSELQHIQNQHKQQANEISKRVQQLGGNPVNSSGMQGFISDAVANIIRKKDTEKILKEAIDGEEMGINEGNDILLNITHGDSKKTIKNILNENENIVNILSGIVDNLDNKQS